MKILRDQLEQRVHVIHRLDRPTTGVLMFGREHEPHAFKDLRMQFELKQVKKTYWAVVAAAPHSPSRDCSEPLQKEGAAPIKEAFTQFTGLAETQVNSHAFSCSKPVPKSAATTKSDAIYKPRTCRWSVITAMRALKNPTA